MLGWNLCFDDGERLTDKYIGLSYPASREMNLYFVSWMVNLEYALERGLRHYIAGWTDPGVKALLGARFTATRHVVYVRNPLLRAVARRFSSRFTTDSQWITSRTIRPAPPARRAGHRQFRRRPARRDPAGAERRLARGDPLRLPPGRAAILHSQPDQPHAGPADHGTVFMGSGDFHHLSWPLIERCAAGAPRQPARGGAGQPSRQHALSLGRALRLLGAPRRAAAAGGARARHRHHFRRPGRRACLGTQPGFRLERQGHVLEHRRRYALVALAGPGAALSQLPRPRDAGGGGPPGAGGQADGYLFQHRQGCVLGRRGAHQLGPGRAAARRPEDAGAGLAWPDRRQRCHRRCLGLALPDRVEALAQRRRRPGHRAPGQGTAAMAGAPERVQLADRRIAGRGARAETVLCPRPPWGGARRPPDRRRGGGPCPPRATVRRRVAPAAPHARSSAPSRTR